MLRAVHPYQGLWIAAVMRVDRVGGDITITELGDPEFIEDATERIGEAILRAAHELKGQPIDRTPPDAC